MSTARDLQDRLAREVAPERPSRARTAARAPSPVPLTEEALHALLAEALDAAAPASWRYGQARSSYVIRPRKAGEDRMTADMVFHEALAAIRGELGWNMSGVEERTGLGDRHLNKLEQERRGPRKSGKPAIKINPTLGVLLDCYGMVHMLVPESIARVIQDVAPSRAVSLTTAQRRRAGLCGAQLELPLPSPVRRVSVAQVEEAARRRAVERKLREAA